MENVAITVGVAIATQIAVSMLTHVQEIEGQRLDNLDIARKLPPNQRVWRVGQSLNCAGITA